MKTIRSQIQESSDLQQETGHLSVLIQRVHNEEASLGYARKETLINIAKFIVSGQERYSKEEYTEAIRVLANFHLAKLANIHHAFRSTCKRLIAAELAKPYVGRCRRCGLQISNPVSVMAGHGPVCRRKLGIKSTP